VLAHAMMARRIEFERPRGGGLARFLASRGWQTVAFDFRGHGDSGPGAADGATWTYDDLVNHDLPAVVDCARMRSGDAKVVVVGHSLGSHVALASQGIGKLEADAIVMFASNVWLRALEPSRARWLVKIGVARAIEEVCRRRGYFPTRALRLGSDDEAAAYMVANACRGVREGKWRSDDGVDYLGALANVKVPVLSIASDGDRLNCAPDCAERFVEHVGGPHVFDRIRRADDGGPAPGHMDMVTTESVKSVWGRAERWMRAVTTR